MIGLNSTAATIILGLFLGNALASGLPEKSPPPPSLSRPGRAKDWKTFSVEMNAGLAFVTEKGFGHGLRYGGGILWQASRKFGLEVLFEKYNVPINDGAEGLVPGEMRTNAVLFNSHFFFTSRGLLRPYAIIGVGFYFIGYTPGSLAEGPINLDFVDRMALQLGSGLDVRLSSRLAITRDPAEDRSHPRYRPHPAEHPPSLRPGRFARPQALLLAIQHKLTES
jgi:hypothetical protein